MRSGGAASVSTSSASRLLLLLCHLATIIGRGCQLRSESDVQSSVSKGEGFDRFDALRMSLSLVCAAVASICPTSLEPDEVFMVWQQHTPRRDCHRFALPLCSIRQMRNILLWERSKIFGVRWRPR